MAFETQGRDDDQDDHTTCLKVRQVLARVGDKWSMIAVMLLDRKPHRFSELKRAMDGISQRMLTHTLRGLERDGLVCRTVTPTVPPRVDYDLTVLGRSLGAPVRELGRWALDNVEVVESARDRFDERRSPGREPEAGAPRRPTPAPVAGGPRRAAAATGL